MLTHGHHTGDSTGLRGAGSAADGRRAAVRPAGVAERGGATAQRERRGGASMVSCLAGAGPARAEGGGTSWAQTPPGPGGTRAGGAGPAPRGPGARVCDRFVDAAPRGHAHRAAHRRTLSSWARVVSATRLTLVGAAAGAASARARRRGHRAVEADPVAAGKKNARRRRAWLLFEDGKRPLAPPGGPADVGAAGPAARPDPHRRPLEAPLGRRRAGLPLGWPAQPALLPDAPRQLHRWRADHVLAGPQAALPRPLHQRPPERPHAALRGPANARGSTSSACPPMRRISIPSSRSGATSKGAIWPTGVPPRSWPCAGRCAVASRGFVGTRTSPSAFSGTRASVSNVTITIIYETH
jgi:hypothetical protein